MVLKAGDMERCLPSLAWHLEEPRVGQSYPNYYAAKLASKFVKVVLSGVRRRRAVRRLSLALLPRRGQPGFRALRRPVLRILAAADSQSACCPRYSRRYWGDVKRGLDARHLPQRLPEPRQRSSTAPRTYINHSMYFEAKTFLHGLFVVEDKLSMAHGLEARVPFMDNDLVDFAMQCPVNLKLNNLAEVVRLNENEAGNKAGRYFQKTNDGKQILRDVMRRHIPADITDAEKQGFSSPDASWFKGDSIDFVRRKLLGSNARLYEYLDRSAVGALVGQHLEGKENRRLLIWSLLNFEQWLESIESGS